MIGDDIQENDHWKSESQKATNQDELCEPTDQTGNPGRKRKQTATQAARNLKELYHDVEANKGSARDLDNLETEQ